MMDVPSENVKHTRDDGIVLGSNQFIRITQLLAKYVHHKICIIVMTDI